MPLQAKALVEMENTGLLALLRHDKYDDLKRMYGLLKRVDGGLAMIRAMMAECVKEQGRKLVTVRVGGGGVGRAGGGRAVCWGPSTPRGLHAPATACWVALANSCSRLLPWPCSTRGS